jgi:hypothetical protein
VLLTVAGQASCAVEGAASGTDHTVAGPPCFSEAVENQGIAETPTGNSDPDNPVLTDRVPNEISLGNAQAWKQLLLNIRHDERHVIEFPVHWPSGVWDILNPHNAMHRTLLDLNFHKSR